MKCTRCSDLFNSDEFEQVYSCFDEDIAELKVCFPCAKEIWHEWQIDQTMENPCQDVGD